ncbi:MAG: hypothetical protein RBU25_18685 [Lentisphaeria bacterium]|jgi:hypothetical protein|nr:hypothetical protein [Lentisphaeria bacterium]
MNLEAIILVLKLVAQGIGVAEEVAALAKRVLAGESVTDAEVEAATSAVRDAKSAWENAANRPA